MRNNNIPEFSIEKLLDGDSQYVIPSYQRNYAWGEEQITQLIQDIIDYIPKGSQLPINYYIGTLVVYEREQNNTIVYETIDGQQRLTTLSILTSVIRNKHNYELDWFKKLNLAFDSRKNSTETLKAVFEDHFENHKEYNTGIKEAYELADNILTKRLDEEKVPINAFAKFLYENVKIIRVPVPHDTNLNHYFEIMNSRGEQLEKHEVLKAELLSVLNLIKDEYEKLKCNNLFHLIWEACSNMERYVQYGFNTNQRNIIFGHNDWNQFQHRNFDDLKSKIDSHLNFSLESDAPLTIDEIIAGKTFKSEQRETDESPDRFTSVINFQNFLLHVLRIQDKEDIPLDDKKLVDEFKKKLKLLKEDEEKISFVKDYAFSLLKSKFLFDRNIIKREFIGGTDKWSLKRLKWYKDNKVSYVNTFSLENNEQALDENRTLLMLLAMFHISAPTMVYKYWLNASMYYLFYQDEIIGSEYIKYLEKTVKSFVFKRFLAKDSKDYYPMIFKPETLKIPDWDTDIDEDKLTFGKITNNLLFNYIDYLLWKKLAHNDAKIKNYDFSARSSVEHYYPQTPMEGFPKMDDLGILNCFGNLCLISHSKNSRLSNFSPSNKKEFYLKNIDSIKQYVMMDDSIKEWNEKAITQHNSDMIDLLKSELK
ncbi:DUF262 domain-containing protein [Flavobacterium tyrosinilyticum]|uniref:DUF262 domain-containing protein n=1 Tax=Flavobacterium tyrosinilyticum TaxID=1658740 RepID=UPI00202F3C56|nr:DUF262 domain-containing protein [Flavobacterium tyrosinilyticum]MCM0666397.1 DUF262 domain-containing HNH endonuclease family protein [Flavobacterium tyrosinilyticum]